MQFAGASIEATLAALCAGVMSVAVLPALPPAGVLAASGVTLMLIARRRWPAVRLLGCLVLAAAWASWFAEAALNRRVDACASGADIGLSGRIVNLPRHEPNRIRFDLAVEHVDAGCLQDQRPRVLRMSWYAPDVQLAAGQHWRFLARIRPLHATVNPGGFDYERWALTRGIHGSGYVKAGRLLSAASILSIDRIRELVRARVASAGYRHSGVLLALAVGDGSLMSKADWCRLKATGTIHLVVISGLHIGLVAGFGWWAGRLTPLLLLPLARACPRQWPAFAVAVMAATAYAALAGWTLPVQRAWLMVVISLAWLAWGRRLPLPTLFLLVLTCVLLWDPLAALDTGFWLSFGAVGTLLLTFGPRRTFGSPSGRELLRATVQWCADLGRAQLVLFVSMAAFLTAAVNQLPVLGPIANVVAVPLTSGVLVPLVLSAVVSGSGALGTAADRVAGVLVWWLDRVAAGAPVIFAAFHPFRAAPVLLVGLLVLVPLWVRWRVLAIGILISLLLQREVPSADGEFRVTALDVGQGLAVVVDTARHRLLYDAGPRYPSGFDLGETVVVPALRASGTDHLDLVVISHADNDHAGGAGAVRAAVEVRAVLHGGVADGVPEQRCVAGQRWQWDGIRFAVLHPPSGLRRGPRNNASCVLLISNGVRNVLLPGDITAAVERRLVSADAVPPLDLLIAPHHGSRTSSSAAFLNAAMPAVTFFSAGYLNRFGHPDSSVVARYQRRGGRWLSTARGGALRWSSEAPADVHARRSDETRFWRRLSADPGAGS